MASLKEQIADLKREKNMREMYYPGWVAQKKKGYTKEVCDKRIECIADTITILERLDSQNKGTQTTLL